MQYLITGATGFVGKQLCIELLRQGQIVRAALRSAKIVIENIETAAVGPIDGETDWTMALCDVNVVIHLAARVHVMKDISIDPLSEFLKVNLAGTENLARQAARAGVKRLVYVSSIKVNGEQTTEGQTFTELDEPDPKDPYGISKCEAERALYQVAADTGLEIVIVRPPLVYGVGVKGNFAQMLKVLAKGIPLPLASVQNCRSLIYVENLVDALIVSATHPAAAGQTFLVSDGEDISTPNLLRQLGAAMGRSARLFSCPQALLKLSGWLIGKPEQVERLLGSLQIDSDKIRRELNWTPPYTLREGLQNTGASVRRIAIVNNERNSDERRKA